MGKARYCKFNRWCNSRYYSEDLWWCNIKSTNKWYNCNDGVLGAINFQAPDKWEWCDTRCIKDKTIAEGTFSASSNATSLVFTTAGSAMLELHLVKWHSPLVVNLLSKTQIQQMVLTDNHITIWWYDIAQMMFLEL